MLILALLVGWALFCAIMCGVIAGALVWLLSLFLPAWVLVGIAIAMITFPLWYGYWAARA